MSLKIFTGKGGVGKTRCSLLYALQHPRYRLTEKSSGLHDEAQKIEALLSQKVSITAQDLLEEFLLGVVKIESLAKFASRSRLLQNLIQLAPNMDELLLLKKWVQLSEAGGLIVDGPSTGNMTAMFDAVETARRMFDGGVLRRIADELHDRFSQDNDIEIWVVSLPENSALEEMNVIRRHFAKLYPKIQVRLCLNRRHRKAEMEMSLSPRLKALAFERPEREAARIAPYEFDMTLFEGETRFVSKA